MCERLHAALVVTFGWMPARVALGVIAFLGFVNLYMVRLNLSIIIVAMVGGGASTASVSACSSYLNTTIGNNEVHLANSSTATNQMQEGELDWSETVQGIVLGSFYYGYATTQILGGRAAEMYGTKLLLGLCILGGGLLTFLIPWAARMHFGFIIALRVLQGIFQGVSWPSMHVLVSHWIPPLERPRFIAYVYIGTTLSTAMTLPLCGVIIEHYGWEAAFYLTGFPSLVWCLVWFTLTYNYPSEHPRISEKEKAYILTKVQESGTNVDQSQKRVSRIPWRSVFTSLPVWAVFVYGSGNNWGVGILFSQLPTYMKNVLGFSIKANGILSALPFLSRYLGAIIWSNLVDYSTSRNYISVHASRRIACIISLWLPGVLLICVAYSGCGRISAIGLMCAALFCNGAISASYLVNYTDIAPNFAGTLLGLDNTLYSVEAFLAPVVVGLITDGQQTLGQWRKVFWTCVPMYGLSGVFYLIFSSASVQPWNSLRQAQHEGSNVHEELMLNDSVVLEGVDVEPRVVTQREILKNIPKEEVPL